MKIIFFIAVLTLYFIAQSECEAATISKLQFHEFYKVSLSSHFHSHFFSERIWGKKEENPEFIDFDNEPESEGEGKLPMLSASFTIYIRFSLEDIFFTIVNLHFQQY